VCLPSIGCPALQTWLLTRIRGQLRAGLLSSIPLTLGLVVGLLLYILNTLFGPSEGTASNRPFECGIGAIESGRSTFSVYFFYFTVLFILFDVELCCLIPILRARDGRVFAFFLILLILGSTIVEIQDGVLK